LGQRPQLPDSLGGTFGVEIEQSAQEVLLRDVDRPCERRARHGPTARAHESTIDEAAFQEAVEQAKENCPVSKALQGNVELTVTPRLGS
jgi:organic hydroperoxide reductase OsmC/OhrA